ncbi:MAG: HMA2 domain-containing protein [Candidatus Competibacterales bacterium]
MKPYVHHVPGRLRFSARSLVRRPAALEALREALYECEAVESVRTNPRAGSITVEYDPKGTTQRALLDVIHAEQAAIAGPAPAVGVISPAVQHKAGTVFGQALFGVVLEKTLQHSVTSLVAALR